jgi:hypothetical protein
MKQFTLPKVDNISTMNLLTSSLIVEVTQKQLKTLRASSYTGTDAEWQAILRWLLLYDTTTTTCSMPLDQVELVIHSIELEKEINVIVRQNIRGITV